MSYKLPAPVPAPQQQSGSITIDYDYDPLYRLTEADYSTGDYYRYIYDPVGNRLTQTTQLAVTSYQYDAANRLIDADGVPYIWDNNGNLLNDGVNTYAYDSANRLTAISNQQSVSNYQYNGLGDRLSQNGVNYTLDLNAGLTQVLNDGTNQYLYGVGRIAQVNTSTLVTDYFMTDALGSVRQLTDAQGQITLANAYEPFGVLAQTAGSAQTSYGFTGEFTDPSGMVYLRARYYMPNDGRFLTRDTWMGDYNRPLSLNRWNYISSNPVNFTDPSGHCAGYKGLDPLINTVMSFTGLYMFDGDHWKLTGNSWKESWNTCVESLQKANAAFQKGDYVRAGAYALGVSAASHQAAARIEQINRELDTIWCEDASLGDRIVAALDVGAWSIGIASFLAPIPYKGWLATKGLASEAYLGGLGKFSYYDDMLNPTIGHSGYYSDVGPITVNGIGATGGPYELSKPMLTGMLEWDQAAGVPYFDKVSRGQFELLVNKNGKLINPLGEIIDQGSSPFPQFISVMDADGNIYITRISGNMHHSSLLAGEPVSYAGELTVRNGIPYEVNLQSGHYWPDYPDFLNQLLDELRLRGAILNYIMRSP